MKIGVFVLAGIVFSLVASVGNANEGLAVYYNPNHEGVYYPSACYPGDQGRYVAGLRDPLWGQGKSCGKHYTVTCIRGANLAPHPCKLGINVTVKIVDYCASPCNGDLNLSLDAFRKIADPNAGIVRVRYNPV